jgi:tetratricopeptide (TPR) repeat protein
MMAGKVFGPSRMTSVTKRPAAGRLESLLGFLKHDPDNLHLIGDAASAAFDAGDGDTALQLLERYGALQPLPDELLNLKGLVALTERDYAGAAAVFEDLRARAPDDPVLKFNLAWAKSMMESWQEALELLDDRTLSASPRAPSLKIHVMHHLGLYDEALAAGEVLAQRFPGDQVLMGALATLALDAEKPDLARAYAALAGKTAEGCAALGFLALGDQQDERSLELFDEALAAQPANPRAWVGKGLGLLAAGNAVEGSKAIDRGAELFGDHIGSWIASGWARFARGDNAGARQSFERATAIDANFSECHGGLAVMDLLDGRIADAERRCDIALRLDRKSFGGALAKTLLLARAGRPQAAQRVRDIAFATPVGMHGETLAQLLAKMASRMSR